MTRALLARLIGIALVTSLVACATVPRAGRRPARSPSPPPVAAPAPAREHARTPAPGCVMLNASVRPPDSLKTARYGKRLLQINQDYAGVETGKRATVEAWRAGHDNLVRHVRRSIDVEAKGGEVWGWYIDTEFDQGASIRARLKKNPTPAVWEDVRNRCFAPGRQALVDAVREVLPTGPMPPVLQYGYPNLEMAAESYGDRYPWQDYAPVVQIGLFEAYGQNGDQTRAWLQRLKPLWPQAYEMAVIVWIRRPGIGPRGGKRELWELTTWKQIVQAVADSGWVDYFAVWSHDEDHPTLEPYLRIAGEVCGGVAAPGAPSVSP